MNWKNTYEGQKERLYLYMPLESSFLDYPICDTDIWIDLSKVSKNYIIFNVYEKAFLSDAVVFELKNKSIDNEQVFKCALDAYKTEKNKGNVYRLDINDSNIFDENEKRVVKKLFVDNDIEYDDSKKCFKRKKHLGEKVSLIYAAVLKLKVLLCDERESGIERHRSDIKLSFGNKFPYIQIVRLKELLLRSGHTEESAYQIIDQAKKHQQELVQVDADDVDIEVNMKKGVVTMNSLSALKKGLELKGKM
ncbi:hypothetical protein [Clostridium thermosuccinogenes]|uniref:hypothetical protein n=1 Tax=Clostridium thermosuccinogenes TaxID=84032 RepID=UPI000CCC23FF|nr:hypothetical protein [Pseudoclostridium thermosuccinogenes]PNT91573.1 hypothetical protein CDQ83_17525 [Pseudoclostridium thermosuccinogenes]